MRHEVQAFQDAFPLDKDVACETQQLLPAIDNDEVQAVQGCRDISLDLTESGEDLVEVLGERGASQFA